VVSVVENAASAVSAADSDAVAVVAVAVATVATEAGVVLDAVGRTMRRASGSR